MQTDHYTYSATWSDEDGEYVGLCVEFPLLFWLAGSPEDALLGVRRLVDEAVADMERSGEPVPATVSDMQTPLL